MLSPLAIAKIRANLASLAGDPDGLAKELADRIGSLAPVLTSSLLAGDWNDGAALVSKLDRVVGSLNSPERLADELEPLGHTDWLSEEPTADYVALGEALLDTLHQRLSSEFDEEARAAWATAFVLVADVGTMPRAGRSDAALTQSALAAS